jgi:hypothetical protein
VTGRRFQRQRLKYKLPPLSLNLPPPEEPLGHPPEDDFDPDSDILSPEKEAKLKEEAVWYHDSPIIMHLFKKLSVSKAPKVVSFKPHHNGPVLSGHETFDLSPLQKAMWEGRQQGKDIRGLRCFPIWLQGNQRVYQALPFKILKELKVSVIQYGSTTPFILEIVKTLVSEPLPPTDWKAIAKTCFWKVIICYEHLSFKIDALIKRIGIGHLDPLYC